MVDAGLSSVTLVQRNATRKLSLFSSLKGPQINRMISTAVFPIEWYKQWMDSKYISSTILACFMADLTNFCAAYYNDQIPLEFADRRTISLPVAIVRAASVNYFKNHMTQDPEKLDALERAGFSVERSGDMVKCTFGNGAGGHHTDVGGRAKIIAGLVRQSPLPSLLCLPLFATLIRHSSCSPTDSIEL
jgi:hypothetical protein